MNGIEKTDLLLKRLSEDSEEYGSLTTDGCTLQEKKDAIRSLMNIRMPKKLPDDLLQLQDDFLLEELTVKGVVDLSEIPAIKDRYHCGFPFADQISLWQGDITRLKIGAIVNAANSQMLGCFIPCHRCIDNAIHSAAGLQLREECNHIMDSRRAKFGRTYQEPVGTATLTSAYNLPCDHVIHTVGPIVYDRLNDALCQDLQNCYANVLSCCLEHEIKSVAFCCISTGEFHFPNDRAAKIAWDTVTDFLANHPDRMDRIVFNVFKDSDWMIYESLIKQAGSLAPYL